MATKNITGHISARKAANRSTGGGAPRKYSPEAAVFVEQEMKQMKQGKLKSGNSGKKVSHPKQAIAIGLSEARKSGVKVPTKPSRKAA